MGERDDELEADLMALGDARSARLDVAMRRLAARGVAAVPALLDELAADRVGGVGRARITRLLAESGAPEALGPILATLDDPRSIVRAAAIAAIAAFDDPRATAALLAVLGNAHPDAVKQAAAWLGDRREPSAVGALGALLGRDDQGLRFVAARALAQIDSPAARALLAAHLVRETDAEVRAIIENARVNDSAH
jgi:HEAT repeat protein